MSTSLAVRHRPTTWATVAGQQSLVTVLRSAASLETVPQQILLAGPSGVGKTTLARIFAAALFCPHASDGSGCGTCETCVDVTGPGGRHPDLIEKDAASNGGVDAIRALVEEAHLAPMRASHRVYIIDEAHGLTAHGAQAFLKLLEEPPPHTLWILATTDPHKLPDALRGRCLQCSATEPSREEKLANLARICATESWTYDGGTLDLVVDASDPALGVRGTVATLDKVHAACGHHLDVRVASTVLDAADPNLLRHLWAQVISGDRAAALASTAETIARSPRPQVYRQLSELARQRLTSPGEQDAALALLWSLNDAGAEHLELAVARAAGWIPGTRPVPSAHSPASAPPAPVVTAADPAPLRPPATQPVSAPPVAAQHEPEPTRPTPEPVRLPPPAPARADVPATTPQEPAPATTTPTAADAPPAATPSAPAPTTSDRQLGAGLTPASSPTAAAPADVDQLRVAWLNRTARELGAAALWLNRATITLTPEGWVVAHAIAPTPQVLEAITSTAQAPVTLA